MSNFAIVGGSGFVGTRLIKNLRKNNVNYKCFDIKSSFFKDDFIKLDIELPEDLNLLEGYDVIVNLAAEHRDDVKPVSRYDDVNVQGAINICEAARKNNINRIIFTSSVAIYGFAAPNTDESGDANYFNDYGRTKYMAELIYKQWQAEDPGNRILTIVRPTVIFGEANRGNVYNLLKQIASKRFIMFGDGKNKKSMAYVENVASFLEFCLSFKSGLHVYNYIDKPDFDMNTLISQTRKKLFKKYNVGFRLPSFLGMLIGYFADLIAKITGKTLPVSSIRVKKFMGTTQFDSSIDKTGFIPPVSLEEGLNNTLCYEFLEDNSDKQTFKTE